MKSIEKERFVWIFRCKDDAGLAACQEGGSSGQIEIRFFIDGIMAVDTVRCEERGDIVGEGYADGTGAKLDREKACEQEGVN